MIVGSVIKRERHAADERRRTRQAENLQEHGEAQQSEHDRRHGRQVVDVDLDQVRPAGSWARTPRGRPRRRCPMREADQASRPEARPERPDNRAGQIPASSGNAAVGREKKRVQFKGFETSGLRRQLIVPGDFPCRSRGAGLSGTSRGVDALVELAGRCRRRTGTVSSTRSSRPARDRRAPRRAGRSVAPLLTSIFTAFDRWSARPSGTPRSVLRNPSFTIGR